MYDYRDIENIVEHTELGSAHLEDLLGNKPFRLLLTGRSGLGPLVLVVTEKMITKADIFVIEDLIKIKIPVEKSDFVNGVRKAHEIKLVKEFVEVPWDSLEKKGKSGCLLKIAFGNALVHDLEFKFIPLTQNGMLGWSMEPDFVSEKLSAIRISNSSQLGGILCLNLDHPVLPEKIEVSVVQLVEDEE